MDNIVVQMLSDYQCESAQDYENALKEIIQEIALLGLWRSKFYEHALFYGGTALRILYGLPRFSEDLDFSLLVPKQKFNFLPYYKAIKSELESFGFKVDVESKKKSIKTNIESAFIKASTKIHFIKIAVPSPIAERIQNNQILKIKVELDTDPPAGFDVEVKDLLRPIPFQVKTMPLADLFAGKSHALLARQWKSRVKGRDLYDYLWYLRRNTPIHLKHLEARLIQSGHWNAKQDLTPSLCLDLFKKKFGDLNVDKAVVDVNFFLDRKERASLSLWSRDYFLKTIDQIKFL